MLPAGSVLPWELYSGLHVRAGDILRFDSDLVLTGRSFSFLDWLEEWLRHLAPAVLEARRHSERGDPMLNLTERGFSAL